MEIRNDYIHCPICGKDFKSSEYLNEVFMNNDRARWLANMIMHYRHDHLKSWDKTWSRGYYYRGNSFGNHKGYDYDKAKKEVNERAKRQILRKAKDFMVNNNFTVGDVKALNGTTSKTIELYNKHLKTA